MNRRSPNPDDPAAREGRCPICGRGVLVELAFDASMDPGLDGRQGADSRELITFSCGHRLLAGSLAEGADALDVERRTSEETTSSVEADAP